MKTLVTRRIKVIVAIILVVFVSTAFAQENFIPVPQENKVENFETAIKPGVVLNEGLVLKVNPTTIGLDFPSFDGICDFDDFDVSICDLSGRKIYSTRLNNVSGQTVIIPINNSKSKILFLTITGKDMKFDRKFFIG